MERMQREVDAYISQFKEGYFPPFEMLARLQEEVGEVAREVQQLYGMKKKKETEEETTLQKELGDVLFVLISFANAEGISLDEAFDEVMNKFRTRDKDRWTKREELE